VIAIPYEGSRQVVRPVVQEETGLAVAGD